MPSRCRSIREFFILLLLLFGAAPPTAAADTASWKVAFFNIQSGKGEAPLPGHTAPFVENQNCVDSSQPMNAWGAGVIQAELQARLNADPQVIALGLGEAWLCGNPENVRRALGWTARTAEHNGMALIARYGFSGVEEWIQLDTALNDTPRDTKWVVRAPVCVDQLCTRSITVFVAHWLANGPFAATTYDRQAHATLEFMAREGSNPHLLVGDLNVFEGTASVCGQAPTNTVLPLLREAGYLDVWREVHGDADGSTGMLNRPRCGVPEGSPWKRIDYGWVRGYRPAGMTRFGLGTPGDGALSDHAGIIATVSPETPAVADPREIVLWTATADTAGAWRLEPDVTAAGGGRVRHADAGAAKIANPLVSPVHYVEMTFDALAGVPYRLWMRGRADRDYWGNDSVFVQFDDTVTGTGAPVYRIGTSSATTVVSEEGTGAAMSGWGWQDNGYGYGVLGPELSFARAGTHTIRVQTREDGMAIDQIVLSAGRYRTAAPGGLTDDTTILARVVGQP